MLGKNRLVTLTGSGGVGKTRLAIQVANKLVGKFKDSVWGLELLAWTDTTFVPQAITSSLGPPKVAFAEAYEEGHVMSFDEAIEFALKETNQ